MNGLPTGSRRAEMDVQCRGRRIGGKAGERKTLAVFEDEIQKS